MYSLESLETELRAASSAHNSAETQRLAEAYRAGFDHAWSKLNAAERRVSPLPAKAAELMRWALGVAQAHKARLSEQRRELGVANRYLSSRKTRANVCWTANG